MEDYPFRLGGFRRPITAGSAAAQTWFDRGLIWTYAYTHEEAVHCFDAALTADPGCAMAHWGRAYALGPDYNLPWYMMDRRGRAKALAAAFDATEAALAKAGGATPVERALIEALPARYPAREPLDDMEPWNDAFAAAMRAAHAAHPEDLDVAAIFAEAMMIRTPWKMWDLPSGQPAAGADTLECRRVLEAAFARPGAWDHPGLLHLYVHLMEMSPTPEVALPHGDRLRTLVPDAGHLIHMPTHIDVQVGAYQDTVFWNRAAIRADEKYRDTRGALNYFTAYRLHNYHFALYGAMFLGNHAAAMQAAEGLQANLPREVLAIESPPMADFLEGFMAMKAHAWIRFGRWDEILAAPLPDDPIYTATRATLLYAKGLAHGVRGEVAEAREGQARFEAARAAVSDRRRVHNNRVIDLLAIAAEMLEGEILYREGHYDDAFAALRRAVALDEALPYDEPWGWMQPARHALAALLLEQGAVAEAEAIYRADLGLDGALPRSSQHPGNIWSLRGLLSCLERRGDAVEAPHIAQALAVAEARADVPVKVSCFCAR